MAKTRVITKAWNDLTDKEWDKEFKESRKIIEKAVLEVIRGDEELAAVYRLEYGDGHDFSVIRKDAEDDDERGFGTMVVPVYFRFDRQRINRYSYRTEYSGVSVLVKATWGLRDIRPQEYGLRKDGTHNLKAISKRVENILTTALWTYQNEIDRAESLKEFLARLTSAHPELEWDEDGSAVIGEEYGWPKLEIEARPQFEEDGFNINMRINGLTMDEVRPLITLIEQRMKDKSSR